MEGRVVAALILSIPVSVSSMSEMTLELTQTQHEILLRGLRYVRSAVALDAVDWSESVDADRKRQYAEISQIESLVKSIKVAEKARV